MPHSIELFLLGLHLFHLSGIAEVERVAHRIHCDLVVNEREWNGNKVFLWRLFWPDGVHGWVTVAVDRVVKGNGWCSVEKHSWLRC